MNKEGIAPQFEFQESPGVNRVAWLTETYFTTFGTHDSQWMVNLPNATPGDWLTYLGTNGAQYRAKVHCHGRIKPHIEVWMENELTNGHDHNDRQVWIDIRDWQGNAWHVEIQDVHESHTAPQFKLTRL